MPVFLEKISMVTFSSGTIMVEEVLDDWIHFLEGRPVEIIFVVPPKGLAASIYEELKDKGKIDKLIYLPDNNWKLYESDLRALHQAVEAAAYPWCLFMKLDTLPYRSGNNGWLDVVMGEVIDQGYFGFTSGFYGNTPYRPLQPAKDGYAESPRFSNNFSIIRKSDWLEIQNAVVGRALDAPEYLATPEPMRRFAQEISIDEHLKRTNQSLLIRFESLDWSVAHINQWGEALKRIRENYKARKNVEPFLCRDMQFRNLRFDWQKYYGHPAPSIKDRIYHWARYFYGCIRMTLKKK